MNDLELIVVQKTGLPRAKARDLIETILTYLKASVSDAEAVDFDRMTAKVMSSRANDPFNEARSAFFGEVDSLSGLDN